MSLSDETMTQKELVREFFARWFGGRWDETRELLAPEFTFTVPGAADRFPLAGEYTHAAFGALLSRIGVAMPNGVEADLIQVLADGDYVVVVARTHGVAGDGRLYDNQLCYVLSTADGLITSCREYLDTIHANDVLAAH
ncbi:nuclear transport factor 2 family protein [Streptomyces sp. NPDC057199]|uniref:nuclear transport factor 2 family protein n=1 Tax=Streptomyces sp. NPDC057199 TaxID=3346047 RepID=UPI00362FAAF9